MFSLSSAVKSFVDPASACRLESSLPPPQSGGKNSMPALAMGVKQFDL
jgi:hypothetical protein